MRSKQSESNYPVIADTLPQLDRNEPTYEEVLQYFRTHPQTFEVIWNCDFLIFGDAALFPRPLTIASQVARGPEYRCDCRIRRGDWVRYFCYTLSGTGAITDPSGSYQMTAGQGFLAETDNPDTSYFFPPESSTPWRFLAFAFHGLQAHVMVRALLQKYGPIYDLPIESHVIQRLLGFEGPTYSPGQTPVHQMQLYDAAELVMDLLMSLTASKQSSKKNDHSQDLVEEAIALITSGSTVDLRVNDVAHRIGVSREHLSRLFRSRLGKSLRTFILEQKVHRACLLLKETDMPIKTIAERLGYTAYSNFSNAFYQTMNMTPREFRIRGILNYSAASARATPQTKTAATPD